MKEGIAGEMAGRKSCAKYGGKKLLRNGGRGTSPSPPSADHFIWYLLFSSFHELLRYNSMIDIVSSHECSV